MRVIDPAGRDAALRRAWRLRWVVGFAAVSLSAAGTAWARSAFSGHQHGGRATTTASAPEAKRRVVPLPRRRMPNDVPLPPHTAAPTPTPAPQPAPTPPP